MVTEYFDCGSAGSGRRQFFHEEAHGRAAPACSRSQDTRLFDSEPIFF
jgi:hypothetical protein